MTPVALLPKVRSDDIMAAMKGMPCALRLSTFLGQPCSHRDTVVGAHLPGVGGKGTSTKVTDLAVVAGCHLCHDLLDARDTRGFAIRERYPAAVQEQITRALVETQARLVERGIIVVPNAEII